VTAGSECTEKDVTKAYDDDVISRLSRDAGLERPLQPELLSRFERAAYLLASAETRRAVADVLVSAGMRAVGGTTGVVALLTPDGARLQIVAYDGYEDDFMEPWAEVPIALATPLSEAVRTRRPVVVASVEELRARYPDVEPPDDAPHGFLALPLVNDGEMLGAWGLRFEGSEAAVLPDDTMTAGQVLSHLAAARVESTRLVQALEARVDQLQSALDSRIVIEQAKGILAERHQVPISVAFEALRRTARSGGRKIHAVARDVIAGGLDPLA
jgi:hypothetical protein